MLIAMGVAAPTWQHVMQDDREQELLYRGGAIADSIARYQKKNGGALPVSLDVLVKGRFLRRAYKDPMTKRRQVALHSTGGGDRPRRSRRSPVGESRRGAPRAVPGAAAVAVARSGRDRRRHVGSAPRRLRGRRQPEHEEEPADAQQRDELRHLALHRRPSPDRGEAARDRDARRAGSPLAWGPTVASFAALGRSESRFNDDATETLRRLPAPEERAAPQALAAGHLRASAP